ncbi:MAG: glycosyltransferase family A protein [Elusimicrobiota bacterium]
MNDLKSKPRVLVILLTYEPAFVRHGNDLLVDYYQKNFQSFVNPVGDFETIFCISDFSSSAEFKEFLREFVNTNQNSILIDGNKDATQWIAFNSAMNQFADLDYVVYLASDVRARDRYWLKNLMDDMEDPDVFMVQTTVTFDGYHFQTQPESLNEPSRLLNFPECLNLHGALFRYTLFEEFDGRYPDIFSGNYTEYCLMYMLAALNKKCVINFKTNLIHDRFHSFRHDRTSKDNFKVRNDAYNADVAYFKKIRFFLPLGEFFSRKNHFYAKFRKIISWWRKEPVLLPFFYLFEKIGYKNFITMDKEQRIALIKVLFYQKSGHYPGYTWNILGSETKYLK